MCSCKRPLPLAIIYVIKYLQSMQKKISSHCTHYTTQSQAKAGSTKAEAENACCRSRGEA